MEQLRQPSWHGFVVTRFLVRQEQARVLRALLCRGQTIFRIQQNRARLRRQNAAHSLLELHQPLVRHRASIHALRFREQTPQRAALVNRQRGDHTSRVGHALQPFSFAFRNPHSPLASYRAASICTTAPRSIGGKIKIMRSPETLPLTILSSPRNGRNVAELPFPAGTLTSTSCAGAGTPTLFGTSLPKFAK